ncbi:FMN reductase (NADH) RutF [Candidatus Anstonella stagnisolia]|nr:FMN reductase (NADH) RutF [Candidatus Anstonella stagnisolia]
MDLGYGNQKASKFATNVGIITTHGPNGENIMSAEWTHYLSYSPALIAVCIGGGPKEKATAENICATKEFGVNLASSGQNVFASIAGKSSGREVDKISVLKEMGAHFYKGKKINCPMLKGAATNAECRLIETKVLGDHTMFVGEVVEISSDDSKMPLVYQFGTYHLLGEKLGKPNEGVLAKIEELKEKYARK